MRALVVAFLAVALSGQLDAQRWRMTLKTQEDMNAYQFYQELLRDFRKKGFWPGGGDTARFVLEPRSMYRTPNILAYFLPTDNAVHVLADTGTVVGVLRASMANPNERELRILFEASVLVHEFSVHWNQYNNAPASERKEFEAQFVAALERKQLNDSLVALYVFNNMKREREAYLEVLKYLRKHYDQRLFSKENFLHAVQSSVSGFYEQYHNPESTQAIFLRVLAQNVVKYKAQPRRSSRQEYAIEGYSAIVGLVTKTLHEIHKFSEGMK
jgi:hypothetical protein